MEQIERLRLALARPLPGLPVQMKMSPAPRPGTDRILDPNLDCRRAGVLVLLYPGDARVGNEGEAFRPESSDAKGNSGQEPGGVGGGSPGNASPLPLHLVLTQRTTSVESHRGQISLPGGSMDPGEDAVAAALREAQEELGVEPAAVTVLGQLSPLYIPPSGFCIYPVVGFAAERPAFVPGPHEVAEVLEVPLEHLLAPATRCEEVWEIRGAPVKVPYYAFRTYKVWGATAMVLCEFLALLAGDDRMSGTAPGSKGSAGPPGIAAAHDPRV